MQLVYSGGSIWYPGRQAERSLAARCEDIQSHGHGRDERCNILVLSLPASVMGAYNREGPRMKEGRSPAIEGRVLPVGGLCGDPSLSLRLSKWP
jgi:hypothetical protein